MTRRLQYGLFSGQHMSHEDEFRIAEWRPDEAEYDSKKERNRIAKRLKLLETIVEAQQIEATNEAEQSWVTSSEMKERLRKQGVNVVS